MFSKNGNQKAPEIVNGHIVDPISGLLIPERMRSFPSTLDTSTQEFLNISPSLPVDGLNQGLVLDRDERTMAVRFPAKGSGFDDLISEAIVDGRVANAGASPVIAPQISAMVKHHQDQGLSASIDVTGKATPQKRAREAIARFDDSPMGVNKAIETMIYRLCTYNRGSPIATVPITKDWDDWESFGMYAHPVTTKGQRAGNATKYWLEVDFEKVGDIVPYLPDPYDLEATGNPTYPYWYQVHVGYGKKAKRYWVLLHCSQIIPLLPGSTAQVGIGNSPVWICLGYLAEQILMTDERVEKMLYSLTDGILLLGGVNELKPGKIKDDIELGRQEARQYGFAVNKGTTIITSPLDKVSYAQISLRQPSGVQFKEWKEWAEDIIAAAFDEPLTSLISRGGVGYGAQAETAADAHAESGVGAHLSRIGAVLGSIYPRVLITVSRPNDRAARMNTRTLATFTPAAIALIDKGVLSREEVRIMIDQDIIHIPSADAVTGTANTEDDGLLPPPPPEPTPPGEGTQTPSDEGDDNTGEPTDAE
jgi:hypothetical protein